MKVDVRRGRLIVLDAVEPRVSARHRTAVYAMTEDGAVLQVIRPAHDPRCGPLLRPFALALDRAANPLVSDGDRLLQFCAEDGRYVATLIGDNNAATSESEDKPGPPADGRALQVRGIAVSGTEREQVLFAVITGDRFAQIRAFALRS